MVRRDRRAWVHPAGAALAAFLLGLALLILGSSPLGAGDPGAQLAEDAAHVTPAAVQSRVFSLERSIAPRARPATAGFHFARYDAIALEKQTHDALSAGALSSQPRAHRGAIFAARPKHVPRMGSEEPPRA